MSQKLNLLHTRLKTTALTPVTEPEKATGTGWRAGWESDTTYGQIHPTGQPRWHSNASLCDAEVTGRVWVRVLGLLVHSNARAHSGVDLARGPYWGPLSLINFNIYHAFPWEFLQHFKHITLTMKSRDLSELETTFVNDNVSRSSSCSGTNLLITNYKPGIFFLPLQKRKGGEREQKEETEIGPPIS